MLVVLSLRPVWDAQYAIPLLGMLLGNATSAVSVGLSTALDDLASSEWWDGCVQSVYRAGSVVGILIAGVGLSAVVSK